MGKDMGKRELTLAAKAALGRHQKEIDDAVARLAALPPPPTCCSCGDVIEKWWNYCAMCGWHLAAGNTR